MKIFQGGKYKDICFYKDLNDINIKKKKQKIRGSPRNVRLKKKQGVQAKRTNSDFSIFSLR